MNKYQMLQNKINAQKKSVLVRIGLFILQFFKSIIFISLVVQLVNNLPARQKT